MKNPAAVELGRRGGLRGGPARAAALTPERRTEIARKAANTRWGNGDELTSVILLCSKRANEQWRATALVAKGDEEDFDELDWFVDGGSLGEAMGTAVLRLAEELQTKLAD